MNALIVALLILAAIAVLCFVGSRALERRAERRFPARGRFMSANGARIHVVEKGQGPAVVLVHGANGSLGDWEPVLDQLGDRFRVFAVDRPGHGHSSRPPPGPWLPDRQAAAIRAAVRERGIERPVLVGFSWGGSVAVAYALDHPDEVAGVVTVGAPYCDWSTPVHAAYRVPAWPVIGPTFVHGLAPLVGRLLGKAWSASAFAPEEPVAAFAGSPWPLAVRSTSYRANAEDIRCLKSFLQRQKHRYPHLAVPVEILHGTEDRVVSIGIHAWAAAQVLPRARLRSVEGAGHMLPYTQPALIVEAIRRLAAD